MLKRAFDFIVAFFHRIQAQIPPGIPWLPAIILCGILIADGATSHRGAMALRVAVWVWAWHWVVRAQKSAPKQSTSKQSAAGDLKPSLSAATWSFLALSTLSIVATMLPPAHISVALQHVSRLLFGASIVVLAVSLPKAAMRTWVLGWLVALLPHAIAALCQRLFGADRGSGGFFDPNHLAACLAPSALLAILMAASPKRAISFWGASHRIFWIALAAIFQIGLLATGSRSGLLALACGVVVAWALEGSQRRWRLGIVLGWGAIIAGWLVFRFYRVADAHAWTRWQIWQQSIHTAWKYPMGVGAGGIEHAMRQTGIALPGWVQFAKIPRQPHNEWIGLWLEAGILGLATSLAAGGIIFWATLRQRPHFPNKLSLGLLATWLIPAMLGDTLHAPPILHLAALSLGLLMRRTPSNPSALANPHPKAPFYRWSVLMLALGCIASLPGWLAFECQTQAMLHLETDLDQAYVWAKAAQTIAPWQESSHLLAERARLLREKDPKASARRLEALGEIFPLGIRPWIRAADLWQSIALDPAQRSQALRHMIRLRTRLQSRDPNNGFHPLFNAEAWDALGDAAKAEKSAQKALHIEPHMARAWSLRAKLASDRNQPDIAARYRLKATRAHQASHAAQGYAAEVLRLRRPPETLKP